MISTYLGRFRPVSVRIFKNICVRPRYTCEYGCPFRALIYFYFRFKGKTTGWVQQFTFAVIVTIKVSSIFAPVFIFPLFFYIKILGEVHLPFEYIYIHLLDLCINMFNMCIVCIWVVYFFLPFDFGYLLWHLCA